MRNPNGYGTVKKLLGNRRKPYGVYITTRFELQDGKAVQKQKALGYFKTRREANICLANYNESPYDLAARRLTFKQLWKEMLDSEFAGKSKSVMKSLTTPYNKCSELYDIPFADIRARHIELILENDTTSSQSTQANIMKLFRLMFNYAIRYDIATKNYAEYVVLPNTHKEKGEKIPFTIEEIRLTEQNINWVRNNRGGIAERSHLIDSIVFLLYTGLRIGEMINLKSDNVKDGYIEVYGTKNDNAIRLLPIHSKVAEIVSKRLSQGNEYLFTYDDGNKINQGHYRKSIFSPFCYLVLKSAHSPHECRHTFISQSKKCGMNDFALKKIVGHRIGDVTGDVYAHITPDNIDLLQAEIEKLKY